MPTGRTAARAEIAGPRGGLHPGARRVTGRGRGMSEAALELKQITKRFPMRGGAGVHTAVDRVDLVVPRNKVVALVGESGSGKTTTGLLALRLLSSSGGQVLLEGNDITNLTPKQLKPLRRRMQ